MKAKVLAISPPTIPSALAAAEVELTFDDGSTVRISDLRVLRNRQNQLWIGWPMRAVRGSLTQIVSGSRRVQRLIEDAVLPEFESWLAVQPDKNSLPGLKPAPFGGAR